MTDDSTGSVPLLECIGAIATIRLARPRQMNKLTPDDLRVLLEHFTTVENDPTIRVAILAGEGRAFSAGFDLGDLSRRAAHSEATDASPRPVSFGQVVDCLENLSVPTICRLNGGVYGGSIDLALSCDFRIGVDTSEMFMPAARLGLHYYQSGIVRYVSRLGVAAAKRLFLTARKIDAAEMLRIGFLDEVVVAEALDDRVHDLASTLASNAPVAMRGMKRAINEFARQQFDADAAEGRHHESLSGAEIREGAAAFAAKRPARF